jgi:plastocyanin
MKKYVLLIAATLMFSSVAFAQTGSITGRVVIQGADGTPVADQSDSIVFIDKVEGKTFTPPTAHAEMASDKMFFVPRVLPILAGTKVDFPNYDTVFHNAFSRSLPAQFDTGHYKYDEVGYTVQMDKLGVVKVLCDIHPKMIGDILVLQNPYFAVTDKAGTFKLDKLPAGKHTVVAWQKYGPPFKKDVEIGTTGNQILNIELKEALSLVETTRNKKFLRKDGRVFKGKY